MIFLAFAGIGLSRRDDADDFLVADGIDSVQDGFIGSSDGGPAVFSVIFTAIEEFKAIPVVEDLLGILEGYAVFLQVPLCLGGILFEFYHPTIVTSLVAT